MLKDTSGSADAGTSLTQGDMFQDEYDTQLATLPQSKAHTDPIDVLSYDRYVVMFSGGKDGVASFLHLLENGVPKDLIEIHHHNVDGEETGKDGLMDWPVTADYCRKFAHAFGVRFSQSWRVGGFHREMLRENQPTAPVSIPFLVDGKRMEVGGEGKPNTRRKFPQVTASLSQRWCSSSLKISASDAWISNDPQFLDGRTLVITGERAEESKARSNYHEFEPHRKDNRNGARVKRFVDHWRPVHKWKEEQVWEIMKRWRVVPFVAYLVGWSRASCRSCIFGNKHQWATVKLIAPGQFTRIANHEREFKVTIHRSLSVEQLAAAGTPYPAASNAYWVGIANQHTYTGPIFTDNWVLPAGAYGDSCGPT